MAYPTNLVKVTFGGSMFNTNEIWQCGLTLAIPGSAVNVTQSQVDALATALGPVVAGYFTAVGKYIANPVSLQWTKVAELGTTGRYTTENAAVFTVEPELRGGGYSGIGNDSTNAGNSYITPQSAVVITLDAKIRGARGRLSRFYLPMPVASIDPASGRATVLAAQFLQSSAEFIGRVNAEASEVVPGLVVVSASKVGDGTLNAIKSVRVGDVIDTMRTRRNGLREVYAVAEVVPSGTDGV